MNLKVTKPGSKNLDEVFGKTDSPEGKQEKKEDSKDKIPLRRFGEPDDVAAPVCWLLTKEAGYVTGAIIDAGGGLWM